MLYEVITLETASARGVATRVIDHKAFATREAFDAALAEAIDGYAPRLVALAGFMRILTPAFVARYAQRLMNIHPSLLPAFPGLDTHARALGAGVKLHGCVITSYSIHYTKLYEVLRRTKRQRGGQNPGGAGSSRVRATWRISQCAQAQGNSSRGDRSTGGGWPRKTNARASAAAPDAVSIGAAPVCLLSFSPAAFTATGTCA